MDLDEQHRDAEAKKHKGIRRTDTEQMKRMMRGVVDSRDYRQRLIRNCEDIIYPTNRRDPGRVLDRIGWDEAVMCAEALGKRGFILEVMPTVALGLTIDRRREG